MNQTESNGNDSQSARVTSNYEYYNFVKTW